VKYFLTAQVFAKLNLKVLHIEQKLGVGFLHFGLLIRRNKLISLMIYVEFVNVFRTALQVKTN